MKQILTLFLITIMMSFFAAGCGGEKDKPEEGMPGEENTAMEDIGDAYDDTVQTDGGEEVIADEPVRTNYKQSPLTGNVVSFNELVIGQDGLVNADEARELVNKGQLLAFKADNGNIYFVYNADGSYASKQLAKNAGTKIGIYGEVKRTKNLNLFIASRFETVS